VYAEDDVARVEQIVALKFLGFSLKQVKGFLEASSLDLREALQAQRRAVEERRAHLNCVLEATSDGDPDVAAGLRRAWSDRQHWPGTLRWQTEARYMMSFERFRRCADFIDAALAASPHR